MQSFFFRLIILLKISKGISLVNYENFFNIHIIKETATFVLGYLNVYHKEFKNLNIYIYIYES